MRKFLRTLLYMLLKFKIYTFLKGKFAEYLQNFLGKTEEEIEKQTTKNPPGGKFLGGIFFPEDGRFFLFVGLCCYKAFSQTGTCPAMAQASPPVAAFTVSSLVAVVSPELKVTVLSVASSGLTFAVRVIVLSAGFPYRQEYFLFVSIDRNGAVVYCFCQ